MNNTQDDNDNPFLTVGRAFEDYKKLPVSGKYAIIPQEDVAFLMATLSISGMKNLMDFQNEANKRGGGFTSRLKARYAKFESELNTLELNAVPASDAAFLLDVLAIVDETFAEKFSSKSHEHMGLILNKAREAAHEDEDEDED